MVDSNEIKLFPLNWGACGYYNDINSIRVYKLNNKVLRVLSLSCYRHALISDEIIEFNTTHFKLIDEAYIDFSKQESWLNRLEEFPNLIITQTFSKAYGLAGIRLGVCYASAKIISILNSVKPPYNVNKLSQNKALNRMINQSEVALEIQQIITARKNLEAELQTINYISKIYESDANFILIKVDDANLRYKQLIKKGIVIRNRTNQIGCENCLRISVGTLEENRKLIQALKEI